MTPINLLRSSSFRLALMYMSLFGFSALVLLGFLYWSMEGFMENQTEETINAEILGLGERYDLLGLSGLLHIINERIAKDESGSSLYLLADMEFNPLAGNLESWPLALRTDGGWLKILLESPSQGKNIRAMARHIPLRGDFHLLVGRDDKERSKVERLIFKSLGWGFALTLVLGVVGGMLMSRGMLRRLDVINRASREIMRGNLARRIPVKGTSDEFDQLIVNLNEMLDRIEGLMAGIRQVSDNIAHDLRSPLNRLRARLEVTLFQKPDVDTYKEAIEQAIVSTDALIATFNALLKIAQAEAGLTPRDLRRLNLRHIAADVVDLYAPVAEERGLALTTDLKQNVMVSGERHLLSQALANLLDNALKYTPAGGRVRIRLTTQKGKAYLVVSDTGPGIPPESREAVLQRFHRLESSRNAPGSGLGLSLTAAVTKLHHGHILLEDNGPGLRVVLIFDTVDS